VGAVNDAHAFGDVIDVIDKDGAFIRKFIDHETVVNNLFANVDGSAKGIERDIHHIDRAHHAGAEAARLEEQNPLGGDFGAGILGR
jgi:hypothetical protein